ncbi:MAG: LVIVD repeat-containing protein [bacterium]
MKRTLFSILFFLMCLCLSAEIDYSIYNPLDSNFLYPKSAKSSSNIELIYSYTYDIDRMLDVIAIDTFCLVCDFSKGLKVFSIANQEAPYLIGTGETGGYVQRMYIHEDKVFVADRKPGVSVISFEDPAEPFLLSSYETGDLTYGVYAENPSGNEKSLPINVDTTSTLNKEPFLYAADRYGGLLLFNVTNFTPKLMGQCLVGSDYCNNVWVEKSIAYVANWSDGLNVVDVHNKNIPIVINNIPTKGFAADLYIVDTTLYLCDGDGQLRIFNIVDPYKIVELGTYVTRGQAIDVYVVNNTAYIACEYGGIAIVDVSNPLMPLELGYYQDGSAPRGVYAVGDYIYVGAQYNGFKVLKYLRPSHELPVDRDKDERVKLIDKNIIKKFDENSEQVCMTIYNSLGTIVSEVTLSSVKNSPGDIIKGIKSLKNGFYFYLIENGKEKIKGKYTLIR